MSNVSTIHDVVPFESGKTKALTGQRLAKVGYKTTKKQAAKFPSIAVSVPQIATETLEDSRFFPHFATYLETVQDKVIRSLYEGSDGQLKQVTDSDIGADAMLAFLTAEAEGSRLTIEKIKTWFDSELSENLSVMIAEKLKLDDPTADAVKKMLNAYRDTFALLAGKSVYLEQKKISSLRVALELVPEGDDEICEKITKKLDDMEEKPIEELL